MTKTLNFDGYELEVHPVSPLLQQAIEGQYKKKNPEPVRPTYETEGFGGVVETFPHDETTVETPEEKEAFLKWKTEHEAWNAGLMMKIIRMFLLKGITLKLTKEQEAELALETKLLDIDVPENKKERDLLWLEMFVVNTQAKLQVVMQAVLGETGVSQEALSQAEELF